jgi:hypothetical protein
MFLAARERCRTAHGVLRMNLEESKYPESALKRLVELRWQREVVARWVDCAQITAESRAELQEMLTQVDCELRVLELKDSIQNEVTLRQAG